MNGPIRYGIERIWLFGDISNYVQFKLKSVLSGSLIKFLFSSYPNELLRMERENRDGQNDTKNLEDYRSYKNFFHIF